jgi:hypothetical protein
LEAIEEELAWYEQIEEDSRRAQEENAAMQE